MFTRILSWWPYFDPTTHISSKWNYIRFQPPSLMLISRLHMSCDQSKKNDATQLLLFVECNNTILASKEIQFLRNYIRSEDPMWMRARLCHRPTLESSVPFRKNPVQKWRQHFYGNRMSVFTPPNSFTDLIFISLWIDLQKRRWVNHHRQFDRRIFRKFIIILIWI